MIAFAAGILTTPATAQTPTIIRSTSVDATSVTVYRAPHRSSGGDIELEDLQGFALISETRTITLPQGAASIRFEGVADGIIAVSALVSGLPGGVTQKNRDAALLAPASLLDGSLGNRVHLRRTSRATGAMSEQDAIIRTGSGGALVIQTSQGLEALQCSGMPETIVYDAIPSGLGDVPVLSVDTVSPGPQTVTITLTYLATGFDWSADYVLRVAEDSDRADLFGWMTIANGNRATFTDAQLLGIAGTLNIDSDFEELVESPPTPELTLTCYPLDGTSSAPNERLRNFPGVVPAPPPPPPPYACEEDCNVIVVTAQRRLESAFNVPSAITAIEEGIGSLRLFRVPFQTTVAAEAQKQVAFLNNRAIRTTRVYRAEADRRGVGDPPVPLDIILKMRNRESDGLGRSIPAGSVAIFSQDGYLIGRDNQRDLTVGEDFEFTLSPSPQVMLTVTRPAYDDREPDNAIERVLTVTNGNPFAITAEIVIEDFDEERWLVERRQRRNISVIRGNRSWTTRVPANGSARLRMYNPEED